MRRQNEMCFELLRHALPAAAASENGSCGGGSAEGVGGGGGVNSSAPLVQLPSSENAGVFRSSLFTALHCCTVHVLYSVLYSAVALYSYCTAHIPYIL